MNVDVLAGQSDFECMAAAAPWRAFDARALDFLAALSERLHRHPLAGTHIDAMGLAFFCRRTHIETLRARHADRCASAVGRGLSFHIAPSNVPINFAYSLVLGLLAGNACIVRASSRDFAETAMVCGVIGDLLRDERFQPFRDRVAVIRYERDRKTNDYFSSLCDVRLIWGGDQTVTEIRRSPLPPRALDLVFADRYSMCVIDAAGYLASEDKRAIAIGFYNDTYRNGQAACTAPRLVYWLGGQDRIAAAQAAFWGELEAVLEAKNETASAIDTVERYTASCRLAMAQPAARLVHEHAPRICRMEVPVLDAMLTGHACGGGFFVEYRSERLDALRQLVTAKFQTVTYIGLAAEIIARDAAFAGVKGVDRIVPSGEASDFDLYWDGYDLMVHLTRHITVE